MNDKQEWLNQIEKRLSVATSGPWMVINNRKIPYENRVVGPEHQFVCKGAKDPTPWDMSEEDAEFIAHARTDIEALVREIRKLIEPASG